MRRKLNKHFVKTKIITIHSQGLFIADSATPSLLPDTEFFGCGLHIMRAATAVDTVYLPVHCIHVPELLMLLGKGVPQFPHKCMMQADATYSQKLVTVRFHQEEVHGIMLTIEPRLQVFVADFQYIERGIKTHGFKFQR